jgi:hypothetical protein
MQLLAYLDYLNLPSDRCAGWLSFCLCFHAFYCRTPSGNQYVPHSEFLVALGQMSRLMTAVGISAARRASVPKV